MIELWFFKKGGYNLRDSLKCARSCGHHSYKAHCLRSRMGQAEMNDDRRWGTSGGCSSQLIFKQTKFKYFSSFQHMPILSIRNHSARFVSLLVHQETANSDWFSPKRVPPTWTTKPSQLSQASSFFANSKHCMHRTCVFLYNGIMHAHGRQPFCKCHNWIGIAWRTRNGLGHYFITF